MNVELARRLVACKHWDWGQWLDYRVVGTQFLPNVDTPQTLGWVLHLVRKAWGDHCLHVRPEGGQWRVWGIEPGAHVYLTEAEALVAALEAAP